MSLAKQVELLRLQEHGAALERGDPEPIPRRSCIICGGMIDRHPGVGRKPYTCGRVACRRKLVSKYRKAWRWRRKNARSRKEWWTKHPEAVQGNAPQGAPKETA